MQIIIRKIV
ncbi:hypothetical protein VCHENC02_5045, partial [Vibrio harveyi]